MTAPTPYIHFPGTARAALTSYGEVFGCEVVLHTSEAGNVVDDLVERPWGASDGQVIDRFGLHWLIGFEESEND